MLPHVHGVLGRGLTDVTRLQGLLGRIHVDDPVVATGVADGAELLTAFQTLTLTVGCADYAAITGAFTAT